MDSTNTIGRVDKPMGLDIFKFDTSTSGIMNKDFYPSRQSQ